MTLFTANGLIAGFTQNVLNQGDEHIHGFMSSIAQCYRDWLSTQYNMPAKYAWISTIPELRDMRAPGGTCLKSCYLGANGTTTNPINDKCGCGGVMRVAPIGLMFNPQKGYSIEQIDKFGADAAALTHGHPFGYIPAAALVHIVNRLTYTNMTPKEAVIDAINTLPKIFDNSDNLSELMALMRKALSLATSTFSDISCIHLLGQGWTGHEALVIAIFCAVRYSDDFEKAIIAAVNHRGDSDSTGAITGNILGAYLGIKGIPKKFINNLELKDLIIEIASDLYACQNITVFDENWKLKYMAK